MAEEDETLIHLGDFEDLVQLLQSPVRADAPCGDSLEDSAAFFALEQSPVFGRHVPPPDTFEWRDLRKTALGLLATSKDLRVLGYLLAAAIRTDSLGAVLEIITAAGSWVRDYPTDVHPQLDGDGIARSNALGCLVDPLGVVNDLLKMKVVSSRTAGEYWVQSALGDERDRMRDVLREAAPAGIASLRSRLDSASEAISNLESPAEPGFPSPQLERLAQIVRALRAVVDGPEEVSEQGEAKSQASGASTSRARAGEIGAIASREDALRALDAVAAYFRRAEPSSPVPLMLERTKRLVSGTFLEVLEELMPDSIGTAKNVFGLKDSGNDSGN